MTEVIFAFIDYPLLVRRTIGKSKPKLAAGFAKIKLRDSLSYCDIKTGIVFIPQHRPLRWDITEAGLNGDLNHDPADLKAFVRGRYWPQIDTQIYQAWLADHGHKAYAELFGRIRYGQHLAYAQAHLAHLA